MGSLENNFDFTGRLKNMSAYKMRGHNKIVLRTRGGASKRQIKTAAVFEPTRNLNNEWTGVTGAAQNIRGGLYALKSVADYNTSGPLNALVKKIQKEDNTNPTGKRNILFSRHPDMISHFSFTRDTLFESLIREPLIVDIDKPAGTAMISIPPLRPVINFFPQIRYAYYRIFSVMAAVSDQLWDEQGSKYYSVMPAVAGYKPVYGAWVPVSSTQSELTYMHTPSFNKEMVSADMVLILGAALQYGMPSPDGSIQPVPYAGAARILKAV